MVRTLHTVIQRWQRDEAALLSAAVAYYIALSLFPLLLILTSGLGAFFRWTRSGQDARDYLLQVISDQVAPSLAAAIEQSLAHIQDYSPLSGPIGMVILLLAALAIFAQFERAFDRMWNVRADGKTKALASMRRMLNYRLRAFAMLCGVGLLVIAVFAIGVVLSALQRRLDFAGSSWLWWGLELVLEVGINAAAFAALYRFLPKVRVRWKDAARGGLLAALIWELGRQTIASFVIGQHYTSAYGIIGAFLAIMLWGYYAVAVVFVGAEYVQVLGEGANVEAELVTPSQRGVRARDFIAAGHRISLRKPASALRLLDFTFAALLLYVALFLGFRHFGSRDPFQAASASQRVVLFSNNPRLQQVAVKVFAPLIASLPGPYHYPSAVELADDLVNERLETRD